MKKNVFLFLLISLGVLNLKAQQFCFYAKQPKLPEMPLLGAEDTLAFQFFLQNQWGVLSYSTVGPVFGKNIYQDKVKAQIYKTGNPVQIHKVFAGFGKKVFSSGDSSSHVSLRLYNLDAIGFLNSGTDSAMGSWFYSKSIPLYQIDTSQIMLFTVDSFAQSWGNFAVGIDFSGLKNGDSIALLSTAPGNFYAVQRSWEQNSQGKNYSILASWGIDCTPALFPVISDATGNEKTFTKGIKIFSFNNFLHVFNFSNQELQLEIFSLSGQKITSQFTNLPLTTIFLGEIKGIHIVKVSGNLGLNYAQKVLFESQ